MLPAWMEWRKDAMTMAKHNINLASLIEQHCSISVMCLHSKFPIYSANAWRICETINDAYWNSLSSVECEMLQTLYSTSLRSSLRSKYVGLCSCRRAIAIWWCLSFSGCKTINFSMTQTATMASRLWHKHTRQYLFKIRSCFVLFF